MPKIKGYVTILEFDSKSFTKALKDSNLKEFKAAAAAFIRAAVPLVPVDTGMARGSFLNLSRALRRAGFDAPVPIIPKRKHTIRKPIWYYATRRKRIPKSPESGASLATPMDRVFVWNSRDQLVFNFTSKVRHYVIMDFSGGETERPWESFAAGREAFFNHISTMKERLPKIKAFIIKTRIQMGPGSTYPSHLAASNKQRTVR